MQTVEWLVLSSFCMCLMLKPCNWKQDENHFLKKYYHYKMLVTFIICTYHPMNLTHELMYNVYCQYNIEKRLSNIWISLCLILNLFQILDLHGDTNKRKNGEDLFWLRAGKINQAPKDLFCAGRNSITSIVYSASGPAMHVYRSEGECLWAFRNVVTCLNA